MYQYGGIASTEKLDHVNHQTALGMASPQVRNTDETTTSKVLTCEARVNPRQGVLSCGWLSATLSLGPSGLLVGT